MSGWTATDWRYRFPTHSSASPSIRYFGVRVKDRVGHDEAHPIERVLAGAGDEQRRSASDDLRGDGGNLRRRLAEAQHDLGKALAEGPMVIDAREAEVRERPGAKHPEQLMDGLASVDGAARHLIEELPQLGRVHDCRKPSVCLTFQKPASNIK